jgi:hypothetical protein
MSHGASYFYQSILSITQNSTGQEIQIKLKVLEVGYLLLQDFMWWNRSDTIPDKKVQARVHHIDTKSFLVDLLNVIIDPLFAFDIIFIEFDESVVLGFILKWEAKWTHKFHVVLNKLLLHYFTCQLFYFWIFAKVKHQISR